MTSATETVRTTFEQTSVNPVRVTLHMDSTGGAWLQTYVRVDPATVNRLEELHLSGEVILTKEVLPADAVTRETEMAWVHHHLNELAEGHAGEWVALDGTEVIAVGPDLAAVLAQSAQHGHAHPFVTTVPTGEQDVPFFG